MGKLELREEVFDLAVKIWILEKKKKEAKKDFKAIYKKFPCFTFPVDANQTTSGVCYHYETELENMCENCNKTQPVYRKYIKFVNKSRGLKIRLNNLIKKYLNSDKRDLYDRAKVQG